MGANKLTVLVGSKNPTKINAVYRAFSVVFPKSKIVVLGEKTPSLVSDQPMSCVETKKGATNRVKNITNKSADYHVGIEGGCSYEGGVLFTFAWVVTLSKKRKGLGKTSLFQLPKEIQTLIEKGVELGEADDVVFKRKNSKHKDGAVGILTKGIINRSKYYTEAVIMSLVPFVNKKLSF